MIYKVFPKGYDPRVASGPPGKFGKSIGLEWAPKVTGKLLAKFFVNFYSNQIPGYRLGQAFVNHFTLNDNELFYEEDDKQAVVLIEKYVL